MCLLGLQICGLLIKIRSISKFASTFSEMGDPSVQQPFSAHYTRRECLPDLLEFTAGSDVSIVVKHKI